MASTPKLTLTYFAFPGRAAVIRKTLTLGGVVFTDEQVSYDQFQQRQSSLPYGKLPVLVVDGVEGIAETHAILRYVGRLTGMYPPPSQPLAAAMVDELLDSFDDLLERTIAPSFHEKDPEKKKQMREELMRGPLPHAFDLLEKRLQQIAAYSFFQRDPTNVFVHEVLAWDYVVYLRSGKLDHVPVTFVDQYPTMVAMHDKVNSSGFRNQTFQDEVKNVPCPTKIKLTYFAIPGRAEKIRLALAIGGIDFEDERVSFQDGARRKAEFPNEQVPVLLVDDNTVLAQSVALLRYVGTITGLYPVHDALVAARIDEVLSHISELDFAIGRLFAATDPVQKGAARDELVTRTIPESLAMLDGRLAEWKTKKMIQESTLTIADLGIHSLVALFRSGVLEGVPTTIADEYTHVMGASEAVQQHPRVQQWCSTQQRQCLVHETCAEPVDRSA